MVYVLEQAALLHFTERRIIARKMDFFVKIEMSYRSYSNLEILEFPKRFVLSSLN